MADKRLKLVSNAPIYKDVRSLLNEILEVTPEFPRQYKYTIGGEMQKLASMKTKLVFNKLIPFNGFLAMTLWPFIFVREELAKAYSVIVNNHEHIHAEQQKELLVVGAALALIGFVFGLGWWALLFVPIFLWWYFLEWLIRIPIEGSSRQAYRKTEFIHIFLICCICNIVFFISFKP